MSGIHGDTDFDMSAIRSLYAAVLLKALQDAVAPKGTKAERRKWQSNAWAWFRESFDAKISFSDCCLVLDLPQDKIIRKLYAVKRKGGRGWKSGIRVERFFFGENVLRVGLHRVRGRTGRFAKQPGRSTATVRYAAVQ